VPAAKQADPVVQVQSPVSEQLINGIRVYLLSFSASLKLVCSFLVNRNRCANDLFRSLHDSGTAWIEPARSISLVQVLPY